MIAGKQQLQAISARRSSVAARPSASGKALKASRPARSSAVVVRASNDVNPVRAAISNVVSGIYQATGALSSPESGLSPLWQAIKRMDVNGVNAAVKAGADLNERDASGDTALLYIARAGHYKYPPAGIPAALIKGGADIEAKDGKGLTALQISLLSGWQNISEILISNGASTAGVAAIKGRLTCPDCKRVVAKYNL